MNYFFLTGTSAGFGKALCAQLLADPSNCVVGCARNTASFSSSRYRHFTIDLADVDAVATRAADFFEGIQQPSSICLINNAGMVAPIERLENCSADQIIAHYHVNMVAPALLSAAFIRATKKFQAEKMIVNISSGASRTPYVGWSAYCSSKAALEMLGQVLALEVDQGYRIVAYDPGVIDTNMQKEIRASNATQFTAVDKFVEMQTSGQLQSPEQAALKFMKKFFAHTNGL